MSRAAQQVSDVMRHAAEDQHRDTSAPGDAIDDSHIAP